MAGLGLIHLGFLAATAAVAVPILIHLLFRPRARPLDIGTLRFLKLALRDSTRRRKLRRWLLLALRTLAVLFLALLFARPYFRAAGLEGREREVVLLIDQSASMTVLQSGKTLFARAQQAAEKALKELPEQTVIHLAYFDAAGVAPVSNIHIDPKRTAGYGGTDYGLAFRWARDLFLSSNRPERKLILFTDLQKSGLEGAPFDGLPTDVEVEIVELGRSLRANVAVETVEVSQSVIRPKDPLVISASILNAGFFPVRNIQVKLSLGPELKIPPQAQTISLDPTSRQQVIFAPPIDKPGIYTGYVEVGSEDEFPLDNRRWLAVDARPPDRILLVDGKPGASVYTHSTYYLEAALRLRLPGRGAPLTPYEPQRLVLTTDTGLPDLKDYRVVALCNVARLSDADSTRLDHFVNNGGGLLIFTGQHVQPEGYQNLTRLGLMPAAVEGVADSDLYHLHTWEQTHPILRPLSDPQQGDLRRIGFRSLTRLKPVANATVLAAVQTGAPVLVEGRLGRGSILAFASTVDRGWTDWPQTRLYVPMIHQMVGYLTRRLPENQPIRQEPTGPGTDHPPGISAADGSVIVRNLESKESDIERVTPEQFRKALHLPEQLPTEKKSRVTAAASLPPGSELPNELWTYVVWILLFLLVAEVFVANRTHA